MSKKSNFSAQINFVPIGERDGTSPAPKPPNNFRMVSWNALANQYIHYLESKRPNASHKVFNQFYRDRLLEQTFQHFVDIDVDFVCLQEVDFKIARETLVDNNSYTRLLTPTGHGRGDTRVDACCIFYKSEDWSLVREDIVDLNDLIEEYGESFRKGNFGIIASFQHRSLPNERVTICNTHLFWNPEFEYVKLRQAHYLCLKAQTCLRELQEEDHGAKMHFIFCGDLNSKPGGLVHTYMSTAEVCTEGYPSFEDETLPLLECPLRHLCLKSIHAEQNDTVQENIKFTNSTTDFHEIIDYMFFPSSLVLEKVLSFPRFEINQMKDGKPILPTKNWASDHLAIGAEYSLES